MSFCGEIRYAIVRTRDEWRAALIQSCTQWSDQGSNRCKQWRDEGSNKCKQWADQGSEQCCTWAPCSWFCDAFYWVAKWVCIGWYWVANWVCQAWYWVAKWVCRAFAWVVYWILTIVAYLVWYVLWIPCHVFGGPAAPKGHIRHVFVLVLENRSFDHMLGLSTAKPNEHGGFAPGLGVDAVTGQPTTVRGPGGQTNPHNGATFTVGPGAPFVMPIDPPHEFCDVLQQLASTPITGAPEDDTCRYPGTYPANLTLTGFVDNYANQAVAKNRPDVLNQLDAVMACLTAEQVPVISTLAREFAVCDNWFSALPGPTWPNRFFLHAATSGGLDNSPGKVASAGSQLDGYQFENGTIYDALDSKELEWAVYHGDLLPQISALAGMDIPTMLTHFHDLDELAADLQEESFSTAYVFIEPDYGHDITHGGNFQCGNSQHPIDDVTRGDGLIKLVYEAIRNSPHWESSLLLITYDEHGGFYDHVPPPPAVPPGDVTDPLNNSHGFRFDQQGVRVPAVVVSPWIPSVRPTGLEGQTCNLIDHTQYDHGSLLATVERLYGLSPLTSRDARANDFLHLLSAGTPRTDAPQTLPPPAASGFSCEDDPQHPGSAQTAIIPRTDPDEATSQPVPVTLRSFVELAAIQDSRLSPDDGERITRRLRTIHTLADALQYLQDVTGHLEVIGLGAAQTRPPGQQPGHPTTTPDRDP